MTVAYVLMKCELGAEEEVIEKLREMDEILFVDETYGAYDLIAKVEAANIEKLREVLDVEYSKNG